MQPCGWREDNVRDQEKLDGKEQGQVLVLFSFVIAALLLCVMAVVDVGFFLHERQQVQKAADAAALAGAQELPDDPNLAQVLALDYVEKNGLDPTDVTITFSCTSDTQWICLDGDGRYDTIRVTPNSQAPSFFGGVLSVIGVDSCWVDGCHVDASAAGCRGACGPVGNAPVDTMMIIDRTGSMSDADLALAKDAAKSILEFFNPELQHVGFGVLGPSSTSSTCSGSYSGGKGIAAGSGGTWQPINLSSDYQNADGTLNNSSLLVKTVNCLNKSSVGTNLGDPVKAATDHLVAAGRPDVLWGLILFTDGAANAAPTTTVSTNTPGDTGFNSCSTTSAVTSSAGDNNGFQSSASSACSNGGSYASDDDSGTSTSTSCSSTAKDKHRFYDFNLGTEIPNGSTINGIEVRLDAWASATTRQMCVELSSDDGSTWTSPVTISLGASEQSFYLGGATDLWSRAWDDNDFDGNDFRIRITNVSNSTSTDFRLDYIAAKVYYTSTTVTTIWDGHLGPCDYAMTQATAAKALGIEVYTIGYNLAGIDCEDDDPTSDWDGVPVLDLLEAMATDPDHFFDEPAGGDLQSVFEAIGGALTANGSRLVE